MDASADLRFGVATAAQLLRLGWSRTDLARAAKAGMVTVLRRGWLARDGAHPEVVAAVSGGGCVACASALRLHGAWVPERLTTRPHVRWSRDLAPPDAPGCRPFGRPTGVRSAVDGPDIAFGCLLRCASDEEIVVIADSLVHLRIATIDELRAWARDAPRRVQALVDRVDAAESGLESIVRLRMRALRVRVRTQVWIGSHRVDMVLGELLVIECDGAEHHGDWRAHAADRARDRALVAAGYVVVRLTYAQIVHGWDAVEQDLLAILRRGAHRAPRRFRT